MIQIRKAIPGHATTLLDSRFTFPSPNIRPKHVEFGTCA